MDWSLSLSLISIATGIVQLLTVVYYAGRLTQKVQDHDRRITVMEERHEEQVSRAMAARIGG